MKLIKVIVLTLFLSGCVTIYNPIPKGYTGATAKIFDSYSNKENTTAHYYILNKIDTKQIDTSWGQTRVDNHGKGSAFTPSIVEREVLPKNQIFEIEGLIFFPTDAQAIFGNNLAVKGSFNFKPKAGESYFVKGELGEKISKVWLEDFRGNIKSQVFTKQHK